MTREEAKDLFRNDKDAYGKPKGIMGKIDRIYDDFECQESSSITDDDIENWVNNSVNTLVNLTPYEGGFIKGMLFGAKAMRDGKIKHNTK